MRKLASAALAAALALSVAGCNFATFQAAFQQDAQKIEAQVAAIIAKIRQNAPIVLADVQTGISLACSVVPLLSNGIADLNASVNAPPPKAVSAISQAAGYANASQAACNAYQATQASSAQTLGSAASTLIGLWNSYKAGKAAISTAQNAVAAGQ